MTAPTVFVPHSRHGVGKWERVCPDCKAARARYAKRWHYDAAHGARRLVQSRPARQRVEKFLAAGWPVAAVERAAGMSKGCLSKYVAAGWPDVMRRSNAAAIMAITPAALLAHCGDTDLVPAYGAARRLRALAAIGWPLRDQPVVDASRIARGQNPRIRADRLRAVIAIYETQAWRPGPSVRARRNGARRGWASPIRWPGGAIDDPAGRPDPIGDAAPADVDRRDTVVAEVEGLFEAGVPRDDIARRLGYASPQVLARVLYRWSRPDLGRRMTPSRFA